VVDIKVRFGAKLQNNHNEAKHFLNSRLDFEHNSEKVGISILFLASFFVYLAKI